MPHYLDSREDDFEDCFREVLNMKREVDTNATDQAAAIIADVRVRGDAAVIELTREFDRLSLTPATIRLDQSEISAARDSCAQDALEALAVAADRIEAFHISQMPDDINYEDADGVGLGMRWGPLDSVGLYVPGGMAAYPSTVLMNAIPARVAGVERRAITVPAPDGEINPLVLAAAEMVGVSEIYRIGGAQAIAALAHGTDTIQRVDKIVGPGNAFVAAAKRLVFGQVGIDSIAGPSEILIVADNRNKPEWIAIDLLSQAEHDTLAQAILITDDSDFADLVSVAVDQALADLPRNEIAAASWQDYGLIIVVGSIEDETPALVDRLAPEHLELAIQAPEALAAKVKHAGAIFLGRHTPEAIGDYVAGPNHVLPTGRTARFSSGLSVMDFLKRTTLVRCDSDSLAKIGQAAITLARAEGLDAHALSISTRLTPKG
ncbi:MAG: histidinol dehydrogenase [Rhodospirillaceae bacterium]|mgnify:CR=1 FL=1|nr:histidinol dehydrogenase [Rhodospirillaceae bacterium]